MQQNTKKGEKINKFLGGGETRRSKQVKEMDKSLQDLKIEIEAINKTQTEGIL